MKFTDEDLKRLKEALKALKWDEYGIDLRTQEFKAILVRLEAAEALIADYPQCEPEWEEKRKTWRKAAGK